MEDYIADDNDRGDGLDMGEMGMGSGFGEGDFGEGIGIDMDFAGKSGCVCIWSEATKGRDSPRSWMNSGCHILAYRFLKREKGVVMEEISRKCQLTHL